MGVTVTSVPSGDYTFNPDNIIDYSVTEDATPIDPSDFSGGYGTITFNIDDGPDVPMLRGKTFDLRDSLKGRTTGIVTNISGTTSGNVAVTTDNALGVLNSWRHLPPMSGPLADFISMVFDEVGIELPVQYEEDIALIPVISRGYVGNVWDYIKQFLSANSVEMSLVFNTVMFRRYRTYEAYTERQSEAGWSLNQSETARSVEVTYYNSTYGSGEFWPTGYEEGNDPVIMQADASQSVEYILQLNGTPATISQPVALAYIGDGPSTISAYVATGKDDLPIQPAQWNAAGGSVTVKISEVDPSQLIVTVVGANIPNLAPFRIAMSSGAGNTYNSLHIVGVGTRFTAETISIPTGASIDTTGTEVGVVVTNPFINTKEQAYDLGIYTAAKFSGATYSVSGTAWDINRRNQSSGIYASIRQFNEIWPAP